ncbi:MAG: homoserine O-succinyltransferase [Clostridiales bacterium]|nr:MAG: homoserine O-succinyltransferase [Clostridiales bacterium]
MPIKIPGTLPAFGVLENENIFVMTEKRATTQDIRPLKIVILNLMPTKIVTETQLLRLLSNSPLQVELTLMKTASYTPKNTPEEHLTSFYREFSEIKDLRFDGLIVTGAPVEDMAFDEVAYWEEICRIFEWSKTNVYSSLFICWAAFAAYKYFYGIEKQPLEQKLSGVFKHRVTMPSHPLVRGFDELFYAPHSRKTTVNIDDVRSVQTLDVLADSERAGIYLAADHDMRRIFVTGHPEYDYDTLKNEYFRDLSRGLSPKIPENYFPYDNPENRPVNFWKGHANLLYGNWLNYFVYQRTPFDLADLK